MDGAVAAHRDVLVAVPAEPSPSCRQTTNYWHLFRRAAA